MTPHSTPSALGASLAAILTLSVPASAQEFKRTIMGGPLTGTYIQAATDIKEMAARCGVTVDAMETEGGLENFLAVRERPFTQMGFVQSDVLEYMRTFEAEDAAVRSAVANMRLVMPLYAEEVQVLAGVEIESIRDLEGGRVGVGPQGGATFMTASLILDMMMVEPAELVSMGFQETLNALMSGEIDAFFFVEGAPTMLFQSPDIDAERWHLLPLTDPVLQTVYEPAEIPADTYGFLSEPVETVAARAMLMTYEFQPWKSEYHRESCRAVSEVVHLITTRIGELRRQGHPKWDTVDMTDMPEGWTVSYCVNEGLDEAFELSCGPQETPAAEIVDRDPNDIYRDRICSTLGEC